jgi:hypothetical protein
MGVYCKRCGTPYADPGGDLRRYTCAECGIGPLVRLPEGKRPARTLEAGVLGAIVGASFAGGLGMVIGGAVGALLERGMRR